jgi:DNA-binding CsgD family transcriptional regulator
MAKLTDQYLEQALLTAAWDPSQATLSATIAQAKLNTINDLLEALHRPCVVLNRWGRVVQLNRKAEALLGAHMRIHRQRMTFTDRLATRAFERAVSAMLDANTAQPSYGPIVVTREGCAPLAMFLVNTDFADVSPFSQARILVLINDLTVRPLAKAEELRAAFSLTRMEARIGEILSDGTALLDAANLLHITDQTARTHLKAIFKKTGVKRQSALMALLARLKL